MYYFTHVWNNLFLYIIMELNRYHIFTLVTLPVEYDASNRALAWLKSSNITNNKEIEYAEDALNWAARTYLVAALAAITYLLYYLSILRD